MESYSCFDASSFSLGSDRNKWAVPYDKVVDMCMHVVPDEVYEAVCGLFLNEEIHWDNMSLNQKADVSVVCSLLVSSTTTGIEMNHIYRHFTMPHRYTMLFQKLEKMGSGVPTSEDLEQMFGM